MNLVLLFTYGVSLKIWEETGLIDREVLLYKRLLKKGVHVTFVTYGDEQDFAFREKLYGIEIVPFYAYAKKPKWKLFALLHSLLLPFILREKIRKAHVVKTNQMLGSWVGLLSKLLYRKPIIVRCGYEFYRNALRNEWDGGNNGLLLRHLTYRMLGLFLEFFSYHLADKIVISNASAAQFIERTFKVKTRKIKLLRNYVDTNRFKPMKPGRKNRDKVLFIGRLHPSKNIMELLKALESLTIGLDVIGGGGQETELRDFIEKKGLDVNFLGVVPNSMLPELINRYPIYVLPSLYENNPKALIEAMACSRAVIGTNVPGIQEMIRHGENGLLCETDANSIRRAIDKLMQDHYLRERLGKNARTYIMENCSLDGIAEKEYSIYEEIVGT
jgi:glycosyltransferase involved in cell wall biosynthesis